MTSDQLEQIGNIILVSAVIFFIIWVWPRGIWPR